MRRGTMYVLTWWIFSIAPDRNPLINKIYIKHHVCITKGLHLPSAQLEDKTKIFFYKKYHEDPLRQSLMSKTWFLPVQSKIHLLLQIRSKPQHSGFKSGLAHFKHLVAASALNYTFYIYSGTWLGYEALTHDSSSPFLKHFQEWNKTNKAKELFFFFFFQSARRKANSGGVLAFDTGDQCEMLKLVFHLLGLPPTPPAGLVLSDWLQFYFSNIVVQVEEGELFKTGALSF